MKLKGASYHFLCVNVSLILCHGPAVAASHNYGPPAAAGQSTTMAMSSWRGGERAGIGCKKVERKEKMEEEDYLYYLPSNLMLTSLI